MRRFGNPDSSQSLAPALHVSLTFFSPVKAGRFPDSARQYSVVWTSGANLWRLSGEHLEDVLSLENRLKVEGTGALWKWAIAQQSVRN